MQLETPKPFPRRRAFAMMLAVALPIASAACPTAASAQDLSTPEHLDTVQVALGVPRVRFGVSGVGGGFVGATDGAAVGLAPRIGVQLDDLLGLYLQLHGLIGSFDSSAAGSRVAGFLFNTAMIDLTLFDRLQLGAGPSLDFHWNCEAQNDPAPCGNGDARFGTDFRIGLVVGDDARGPGERRGIVISLEVHPTWLDPSVTTMMLFGVGGELY